MKKYLLPETGSFYKANLHSHSTVSDGALTPQQMKEYYMEQGYSIIAYTDHEVMIPHPELADENFLPLNGYKVSDPEAENKPFRFKKTTHLCLIALDPDNWKHIFKYDVIKDRFGAKFVDEEEPELPRDHNPECVNEIIRRGCEHGFFVTYNHPSWSLDNYSDYINYHGMHAMEICNYGSEVTGHLDYNEKEYDDILRGGERIYCIAADDNHNKRQIPDSFGGFTMIKADKLEYKTITSALLAGHFYASQGPQIHTLWYEDGRLYITCSDATSIVMHTAWRRTTAVYGNGVSPVTEAVFDVDPDDGYVRITVTDLTGRHANTNAYFLDDLLA